MKQILFTVLALIISTMMFAQNNSSGKQSSGAIPVQSKSTDKKKIHYLEKRTKPVQVNSGSKSKVVTQKKPVRVAVKKDKVFSK